jgi:hypothetical protein
MKILYLTKYTRLAGSSRMRSYQYFPYLEEAGMQVTVKPFFDNAYLKDFYAGKKNISAVLKSYVKRLGVLFSVFSYDRVVIEKEIFPFLPAWAEWMLKRLGIQYIVDYDDAIFHNYDQSSNPIIKKFLANKIAKVMRFSGTVVAGNQYLADYATRSGAKNIEIIPTVIDLERYPVKNSDSDLELPPNVILSGVEGRAWEIIKNSLLAGLVQKPPLKNIFYPAKTGSKPCRFKIRISVSILWGSQRIWISERMYNISGGRKRQKLLRL